MSSRNNVFITRLLGLIVGLLIIGLCSACGLFSKAEEVSHLDQIQQRQTLRVGTTGDYRPFSFLNPTTQTYEGRDIDAAYSLAKTLNVSVTFVQTTWPTLLADLNVDKFDIAMGGISITPARLAVAAFSDPYLLDGKVALARCVNYRRFLRWNGIDQPGVRVIENPGGTNEAFARARIKRAQVILHPQNDALFDMLVTGQADVMFTDSTEAVLQEVRHPGLCAINPTHPLNKEPKAYLLPKGDTAWRERVNQWLKYYQGK